MGTAALRGKNETAAPGWGAAVWSEWLT